MKSHKFFGNQYKLKHKYMLELRPEAWTSIWFVAFVTAVLIPAVQPHYISPCPDSGCHIKTVYAKETVTELEEITSYIIRKFQPLGRDVATRALACFISESGLKPEAYGWNEWNKTADVGISQINDVHGLTVEERKDWKKNIDKAYQIYKSRGNFSAWYGRGCK